MSELSFIDVMFSFVIGVGRFKSFIVLGHANIDKRGLNRYGLHLNRSGTSLLAKNLIEHIKCF